MACAGRYPRGSTAPADRGHRGKSCRDRRAVTGRGAECRAHRRQITGPITATRPSTGDTNAEMRPRRPAAIDGEFACEADACVRRRAHTPAEQQHEEIEPPLREGRCESCRSDRALHPLPTHDVQRQTAQRADAAGRRREVDVASALAGHRAPCGKGQWNDRQHTRALRRAWAPWARRSARAAARSRSTAAASSSVAAIGPPSWAVADSACTVRARSACRGTTPSNAVRERPAVGQASRHLAERCGLIDLVNHGVGEAGSAANLAGDCVEHRGVVGHYTTSPPSRGGTGGGGSARRPQSPGDGRDDQRGQQSQRAADRRRCHRRRRCSGAMTDPCSTNGVVARLRQLDRIRRSRSPLVRCRWICRRE